MYEEEIQLAKEKFGKLLEQQIYRLNSIKQNTQITNYCDSDKIIIGICGGDGIGPSITEQAVRVIQEVVKEAIEIGKIELRNIKGLTIENRVLHKAAIPDDVLAAIRECNVFLKGPTTTPRKGDKWINVESANVAMRKKLDLFANVRPVVIPSMNIDWTFFRENTEGSYAAGNDGINVTKGLGVDFTFTTNEGSYRIIKAAFDYAIKNHKTRVTAVTKANIIKTTDGKFLDIFYAIAKDYPSIRADDWYIDIMTAKLLDKYRRSDFQVMVLPNLYGDIITDEAAELQGGVGKAGSANIGMEYAMFEAIHGSAPRMVEENRQQYADPSSIIRAAAMLLSHIGYAEASIKINCALDICQKGNKEVTMTGREDGVTNVKFTDYLIKVIQTL